MYESAEEELIQLLQQKHIDAVRHEIDSYETVTFSTTKPLTVWGAEGTSIFTIGDARISMQPGDTLDIPAGSECTIATSLSTFAWYQA